MAVPSSVLKLEEIQGRGRGIVASQPLKAGQVILTDSPILLYPTYPFSQQHSSSFCDHCFKSCSSSSLVSCPSCHRYRFCDSTCLSKALNSSHSTFVCQSLSKLHSNSLLLQQTVECQLQARFLIAAYNLAVNNPTNFQILLSLQGSFDNDGAAQFLHPIISSLFSHPHNELFSLQLTSSLLAKDKLNAFGIMHPFSENDGHRSVRAYGIYPYASFFNHDCLPNACRFDYVDVNPPYHADGLNNTDFVIRMIHDVPQGREICLSYFPVNENYSSRQKRLLEDYGFACNCDRCNVESNWSDNESVEENAEEDKQEIMVMDDEEEDEQYENMEPSDTDNNDFPHAYFFLKYMCDRTNCGGTLAPLPPKGDALSNVMECNVCGKLKKDDDDINVGDNGQDGEVPMED
ncbi:histone-lysine N-methyltransferase ASHR2 [Vicia villosa]|uniref:histone-lysine N-methyltransferase ASHR2 n=1 Tax=Vicia villosa TaxID=3911 RepID=UPI00273C0824|nr:histone-lysine N-methyltransferase ASHR2 [Vicia villosa]XP_058731205.1 histone-lysine N-methyltransferase ASHR2 [Vicia villosa]